MADGHDRHYTVMWKYLSAQFSKYLDDKTSDIDHHDVISDLAGRTELSGNYFSSLIFANLIALFGLLINSVAVVIGAMLISPLMGPIFSLGLAFSLGDLALSRRAVKNITYSILLTVFVAALFTLLSPLKGATHEILARTHPNIYDLLIAFFSGTAGALAICTRKNYLFTTTGVAVATAVIPPLSVVGYGVGTLQLGMAMGGFLLFFTNLVAIVISSNLVFYILRFRGSMAEEPKYTARRRFQILGTVLVIISIPLVYTLVTDIRKVNLTGRVESVLKTFLDRYQHSRLTSVSIVRENGDLMVAASVNTVKFIDGEIQKQIENELTSQIGRPAKLDLEQVIVRSGAVEPQTPLRTINPVAPPPPETLATLREKTLARLNEGCREVDSYIKPFKISSCDITFSDRKKPVGVKITVARDYPSILQEQRWITTVLEKKLAEKIELKVDTTPFLPAVSFTDKEELDDASRKALEPLKQIFTQWPDYSLTMEIPRSKRMTIKSDKLRATNLKAYLLKDLAIPADRIAVVRGHEKLIHVKVENVLP